MDSIKVENIDNQNDNLKDIDNEKFQSTLGPNNPMFASRTSFQDHNPLANTQTEKEPDIENVKQLKNIFGRRKNKQTFKK